MRSTEFITESIVDRQDVISAIKEVVGTNSKEYSHGKNSNGFLLKEPVVTVIELVRRLAKVPGLHRSAKVWGSRSWTGNGMLEWSFTGTPSPYADLYVDIDSHPDGKHVRKISVGVARDLS